MKKNCSAVLILLSLVILSSCAHSPSVKNCVDQTNLYGFWSGTWHGMIMVFSFIGSLFDDTIKVYAVNNNGHWYDFGFVGGFFMVFKMINYSIRGALYDKK